MTEEFTTFSFFRCFSELEDPRIDRKKLYPLEEILFTTLCSVICGSESWYDIEDFGEARISFLKSYFPYENGIPSHDTIGRFFSLLNPHQFNDCFIKWMQSLQENLPTLISIDGKTVRRSFDKTNNKFPIHMISAFASNSRLVLGQCKVDDKSNEIVAIPQLLDMLLIKGAIITIDAMGCQKKIAEKIVNQKAHYVLGLKENQENLLKKVIKHFEDIKNAFDYFEEVDKGHGRIEIRKCWASSDILGIDEKKLWPNLQSIIKIESKRIIGEKESKEIRYYITDLEPKAKNLLLAIRSHWSIENSLHWTLDMTFREDESRIRKKNAPENMAIIRRAVLNLLRLADEKISIRRRKKKAGWSNEYLENVLKKKF
jgi:predicted transposase YbfD/YdcC